MSETEQAIYKIRMDNVRALQEANVEHAKAVDLLDKQAEMARIETAHATATGQSGSSRITNQQAQAFGLVKGTDNIINNGLDYDYKKGAKITLQGVRTYNNALLSADELSDMGLKDAKARLEELKATLNKLEMVVDLDPEFALGYYHLGYHYYNQGLLYLY